MLYRIYTEDKNWPAVKALLDFWLDGYTVMRGEGYWHGTPEPSVIIDIITDAPNTVTSVAKAIQQENDQEAVLVCAIEGRATLVEAKAQEVPL